MVAVAPRRDALPEEHDFADDGCRYCPIALECPHPECLEEIEERGGEEKRGEWEIKVARAIELLNEKKLTWQRGRGWRLNRSVPEIARMTGLTERTIFRWKVRLRRRQQ